MASAFCGLVLVFGSKLVSYAAASLPFGVVSEPRKRPDSTPAGGLVVLALGISFVGFWHAFSSGVSEL